MKRTIVRAVLLLGVTGLGGCGGGKTTDPKSLPPLTQEDMEQIKKQDATIQDEEANSVRAEAPKGKKAGR